MDLKQKGRVQGTGLGVVAGMEVEVDEEASSASPSRGCSAACAAQGGVLIRAPQAPLVCGSHIQHTTHGMLLGPTHPHVTPPTPPIPISILPVEGLYAHPSPLALRLAPFPMIL